MEGERVRKEGEKLGGAVNEMIHRKTSIFIHTNHLVDSMFVNKAMS